MLSGRFAKYNTRNAPDGSWMRISHPQADRTHRLPVQGLQGTLHAIQLMSRIPADIRRKRDEIVLAAAYPCDWLHAYYARSCIACKMSHNSADADLVPVAAPNDWCILDAPPRSRGSQCVYRPAPSFWRSAALLTPRGELLVDPHSRRCARAGAPRTAVISPARPSRTETQHHQCDYPATPDTAAIRRCDRSVRASRCHGSPSSLQSADLADCERRRPGNSR